MTVLLPRPTASPAPAPIASHPARTATASRAALEIDARQPFHRVVAQVQQARLAGYRTVWVTGPAAPAVASRLLRLTVDLTVGAELDLTGGLEAAALDAVALAEVAGGRAHVLVRDVRALPGLVRHLGQSPRPRRARFGGDAFAATIEPPTTATVLITAAVHHQGEVVAALPYAHALLVVSPTGVDAHGLVRRARAAATDWPGVSVGVAVPQGERRNGWPHADGVVAAVRHVA